MSNETVDFFAPPIQVDSPPPEDFDREFGELEFERPLVPFEDMLFTLRDTYPVTTSTPSLFKFKYSPNPGHMSDHCSDDIAPSVRAVHGTPKNSNSSDTLPDLPAAESSGSWPSSPPVVPSNHGISDHIFSVIPDDRSRTLRQSANPNLPAPAQKKKKLKLYMCNICKHRFSHRHEVRRHIEIFHGDHESALSTHLNSLIISVPVTQAGAPGM